MKPILLDALATKQDCEWACEFVSKEIRKIEAQMRSPQWDSAHPEGKQTAQGNREPWILDWGLPRHQIIEEAVGCDLYPMTVFWRVMGKGFILYDHKDWKHCQVSASITCGIGGGLEKPTPLNVEGIDYDIGIGQGLIYDGVKQMHSRPEQPAGWQMMMLIHYLRKDSQEYKNLAKVMDTSVPYKMIPHLSEGAGPLPPDNIITLGSP